MHLCVYKCLLIALHFPKICTYEICHFPSLQTDLLVISCFPMAKQWFYGIGKAVFRCRKAVSLWVLAKMGGFETGFVFTLMKKALLALLTCSLALGGAGVGTITGAIKGQTTETGFVRGAAIGAVAGAVTAVQLMELTVHDGEPFSKVALLLSLINGKVFMEWVSPAVLKAYQWQISTPESSFSENSDIFDVNGNRGLSQDCINKLPKNKFQSSKTERPCHAINCIICLEDFKNGEYTRMLPSCRHSFHLHCIDGWLNQHGSCPICRKDV
ncbi:unnamed protein product [Camellia sinensis]